MPGRSGGRTGGKPDHRRRAIAAAALREGRSISETAALAGVHVKTVEAWVRLSKEFSGGEDRSAIPYAGHPVTTPEAVLRGALHDPSATIRIKAAAELIRLNLDAGGTDAAVPEATRIVYHDEDPPNGHAIPYTELHVWNGTGAGPGAIE